MSKKYLECEALVKSLEFVTNDTTCPIHIAAYIDQIIAQEPTADVELVQHGKWIEKHRDAKSPEGYYYWNTPLTHIFVCSECGRQENKREPYCHCGAKMDGKDCEEVCQYF